MKNLLIWFGIVLMCYHAVGSMMLFNYALNQWNQQVKSLRHLKKLKTSEVKIYKTWDKNIEEFWENGAMYDIVKTEPRADSVAVWLFRDDIETQLHSLLDFSTPQKNAKPRWAKNLDVLTKYPLPLDNHLKYAGCSNFILLDFDYTKRLKENTAIYRNFIKTTDNPPPELA